MRKMKQCIYSPILRRFLFCILFTGAISVMFFPSICKAWWRFSSEKTPEDIAKEYGDAVVSITASDKDGKVISEGSGFIIDADGTVVTNYHLINGTVSARVRLTNGAYFDVVGVLGAAQDWDMAVLKIEARNLHTAPVGDSDEVSVGERVVTIGNPMGLENTVSVGNVSAIRSREDTDEKIIQFTAPISPGSSGGPLFNAEGKVVGVTVLHLKEGQNLNFAIPINRVKPLLKGKRLIALSELSGGQRPTKGQSSPEDSEKPGTEEHFMLGVSYFSGGKNDLAIKELKEAIRLKPDFAEAHYSLGVVYATKGQSNLAIRQYEEAIRIKPDMAEAYFSLGMVSADKGLYDLAIRKHKEAIRLDPDFAEAHYTLGVLYNKVGQYNLAIKQSREAIRIKPDMVDAHYNLGVAYAMKDHDDLAIRQFEEAIRLKPDFAEAHYKLGVVYAAKGQSKLAIRQYEEAIRIKPDLAVAHYNLGRMYRQKGLHNLATRHTEQALLLDPNLKRARELLDLLYQAKRGY